MKKHIIALSAIVLFSVLQGANAATMEDKPMATEMQQPMQPSGTETMAKPMTADETQKTMMPATPMMEQDKNGTTMGTMKQETMKQ